MPNAIKMLQDDHNSARILFGQIQQVPAGHGSDEDKAATQITTMLRTHNVLVDEFIQPLLSKFEPEVAKESDAGRKGVYRLLADIEKMPTGQGRRDAMFELQEVVKVQGDDQERSVYPLLTEKLGLAELEDLGLVMMTRQQELLQEGADIAGAASTARPQNLSPRI